MSALEATDKSVVTVLGICPHHELVGAAVAIHGELIDLGRQIIIHMLLVGVEPDSFANRFEAFKAPGVKHHLKSDLGDTFSPSALLLLCSLLLLQGAL